MTPAYDSLLQQLKRLPGLGYRSAERVAMHLLVEKPDTMPELLVRMKLMRASPYAVVKFVVTWPRVKFAPFA